MRSAFCRADSNLVVSRGALNDWYRSVTHKEPRDFVETSWMIFKLSSMFSCEYFNDYQILCPSLVVPFWRARCSLWSRDLSWLPAGVSFSREQHGPSRGLICPGREGKVSWRGSLESVVYWVRRHVISFRNVRESFHEGSRITAGFLHDKVSTMEFMELFS